MDKIDKDRFYGTIYGGIYGDAFGARYEFTTEEEAIIQIKNDMLAEGLHPILGGGPFNVDPGQVTDDSEMLFGLLEVLNKCSDYKQDKVAENYIRWYRTKPFDIGFTITRSLHTQKRSENNTDMIKNSLELNNGSLSNGTMMRIAPLGLLGLRLKNSRLKYYVEQECNLTHPNEIVKEFCYLYCLAIKYAVKGYDKNRIYNMLKKHAKLPRTKIVLRDGLTSPSPVYVVESKANEVYVNTDSKKYQGYIGIAFQNTIYELMNGDNPSKSIVDTAKRGGDTDTNCAIVGALVGALYGKNRLDPNWYKSLRLTGSLTERYKEYPFLNPLKVVEEKLPQFYNSIVNKKKDET